MPTYFSYFYYIRGKDSNLFFTSHHFSYFFYSLYTFYAYLWQKRFNEVKQNGHQEAWQEVNGLAVLDAENAEAGADDKHTADDAQLHSHLLWHSVAAEIADGIEHSLPAEQDGRGKKHYPSI